MVVPDEEKQGKQKEIYEALNDLSESIEILDDLQDLIVDAVLGTTPDMIRKQAERIRAVCTAIKEELL